MPSTHDWTSMPVTGLAPAGQSDDPADLADLVVRNARIYTGDPRRPYAGAIAIRDGRVLAVGDDYSLARHVTRATRVVDAMGRRVIPGLIDSHMHVIRTGLHYLLELRWDGVRSLRQALAMLRDQAARTPPGQWVRVLGGWSKERFGLTSAIDAAGGFQSFPGHYAAVTRLAADGALSVRLAYYLFPQVPGQELDDIRRWTGSVRPGDGDDWLRLAGAGESLVWSAIDFENFGEPRPELPDRAAADLEAAVRLLAEHGWPFRLHATYDETIRTFLEVFSRTGAFPGGVRWILDHAETISPQSIDRVAALGGAVSVQHRMAYQGRAFAERYGPERAAQAPPVKGMLACGLTVAAATDAPRVSTYNPWVALEWLVRGRTVGGLQLYGPDNVVDRETALRMYTRAGAELTGEADRKGMLAEGYLADLAVLSDDYLAVPAEEISRIESVLTITGGKIVYAAAEHEGLTAPLPPVEPA